MNTSSSAIEGQIISAHSYDVLDSSVIELWLKSSVATDSEINKNASVTQIIIEGERPVFFIRASDSLQAQHLLRQQAEYYQIKPVELKTFKQQAVAAVYCANLQYFYLARKTLQSYTERVPLFESDIPLHERYLMERFCYGCIEVQGEVSVEGNYKKLSQAKIKPSTADVLLDCLSVDIECSVNGELYSIGFHSDNFTCVLMIANPSEQLAYADKPDFLHWLEDEKQLLEQFQLIIQQQDPDIIIGWNVINFDFKLLFKRAQIYGLELLLGRDGSAATWRNSRTDAHDGFVSIKGRMVVDGIDALKAETYHFASFSLQAVAQTLLGESKLVDTSYSSNSYDAVAVITDDFHHNKVKLAEYNLQDCRLVSQIFEKTQVLDFLKFRSKLTGLLLDKRGGSVAAFTNLYLPKLHRAAYIAPNLPANGGLASPGGYVMDSKPGLYKNVLVLDFKSLYPSIIRTFKIDPLGLIEGLLAQEQLAEHSKSSTIEGFKGAVFSRDKHFLPDLISSLWQQRDVAKKENDTPKSNAIKIIMNSFYGVLGSGGCRFYDTRLASSITMRGHQIMKQSTQWIEAMGHNVIYGDTDSLFVALDESYSQPKCFNIAHQLVDEVNRGWQEKCEQEFQLPCHLELEFETHYSRFMMPKIRGLETGSKKRYAGLVITPLDEENKTNQTVEEKIVFKGLEAVRTDWTELARDFQYYLVDAVFHDKDPVPYIKQTVFDTMNGKNDHLLNYRKRLRKPLSEYQKNIPPHAQAAIKADSLHAQQGQALRYQNKGWIEYKVTLNGPEAIEHISAELDYEHYVLKQLQVIADGVLPFIGLSFEAIFEQQLKLF